MKTVNALVIAFIMIWVIIPFANAADGIEYAMFPLDVLDISRTNANADPDQADMNLPSTSGHGYNGMAIDLKGTDQTADTPFSGTIVRTGTYAEGNYVIFQSKNEVVFADGHRGNMTCLFIHDENISDLWVGKEINQGVPFYQQGNSGNSEGVHLHLETAYGHQGSIDAIHANKLQVWDALYLKSSTSRPKDYIQLSDKYGGGKIYLNWRVFVPPTTYTVTYNANGGTGAPAQQTKTSGTTLKLSSSIPTRSGYNFKGWGTNSAATTAAYAAGADYTTDASITLYAIWGAHTHTYDTYSTWGAWSAWALKSAANYSASDTREVQTTTMYRYYYFVCQNDHRHTNWGVNCPECGKYIPEGSWHELWSDLSFSSLTVAGQFVNGRYYTRAFDGRPWYFETTTNSSNTALGNRYRDRSKSTSGWTVTTAPTCITAGTEVRACTSCNEKESRSIPATGHSYGNWSVTQAATCTSSGIETRKCINNANHTETRSIAALGHRWSGWTVITPASAGIAGQQERTCSVCKAKETQVIPPTSVPISGVTLNSGSRSMKVGDTYQLTATISPSNTTDSKTLIWSSSNANIASVSTSGSVTAKGPGTAVITVKTINQKAAACTFAVTAPITGVSLNTKSVALVVEKTCQLTASISPSNTTDSKTLTWSSSNANIASVSPSGLVTAKGPGTAVITAKAVNEKTATCSVEVSDPFPKNLAVSKISMKNANLSVGDKALFTIVTGKAVTKVSLYDKDGMSAGSTKSYKTKGSTRTWTISKVMTAAGQFKYRAVASKGSQTGRQSSEVDVNVSSASLEVGSVTFSKSTHNVGETLVIRIKTGLLASRVNIFDADGNVYATASKPSKKTSSTKTWTINRRLTEHDMGTHTLKVQISSKYGTGPMSSSQTLTVVDLLPRVISITPHKTKVKRGSILMFTVVTNAAATGVQIRNDKKELWKNTEPFTVAFPGEYRRTWQVTTLPRQTGDRKFFAQGLIVTLPGAKSVEKKIKVTK